MKQTETRPAPRVVHLDGREVTLIPERQPERGWRRRPGGWDHTLEDGSVVAWIYLEQGTASKWTFVRCPQPHRDKADQVEQPEAVDHAVRRPLAETPWNEMTAEQKRLAIDLGLYKLKEPSGPTESARASQAAFLARQRAREEAFVRFNTDPNTEVWRDENAMVFEESYAERRSAAEYHARREGRASPFEAPQSTGYFERSNRSRPR